jgi:TP901 family phage tail tape measure protein
MLAYDQAVMQSAARTTTAVDGSSTRQASSYQRVAAAAQRAAVTQAEASSVVAAAKAREQAAGERLAAAQARLEALRASGTASNMRLALAEDNVAQATLRLTAAQQSTATSTTRLMFANQELLASQTRVTAANSRQMVSSDATTVSLRAQQVATSSLASANGLLGTSLTPLTAGLGAVALGLGYAAYRGSQFDTAMSGVQAATMASAQTMGQLRDLAIELGGSTQYSAEEAAQGITELAKAGVSTADILGGGLAGALDLAASGQLEVADAAEIAATQMVVFNLAGNQTSHVADLLAAGAGKAQGSVSDMALALQYAGLPAAGLGLTIEETAGTLGLFASNGLVGEKAGTSFRGMLVSLTNPVGKSRELMDELGLSFFDASGQFIGMEGVAGQLQDRLGDLTVEQRNASLAQLFGNEALGAAQALYKNGAAGVREWTNNVDDAGFAAEQAAMLTDNLSGDLERMGGSFDSLMTTIGGGLQGPLRDLVQSLTWVIDAGGNVIQWLNDLPGPVQVVGAALVGLYLINGPLAAGLAATGSAMAGLAGRALGAVSSTAALQASGSRLLGVFGGPMGLAIGATAVTAGYLVSQLFNVGKASVDTGGYIDTLTGALQESRGAIDDNVRALAAQQAADTGLRHGNLLEYADKAGVSLPLVTDALTGNQEALRQVTDAFRAYGEAQAKQAQANGSDDAGGIAQLGIDANEAADAVTQLAGASDGAVAEAALLAEAAGTTGTAIDEAGIAAGTYGALLAQVGEEADASADQLKSWLDMIRQANGSFADPLGTYNDLLAQKQEAERASAQSTADSTEHSSDSWEDYATDVTVSLNEYAAQLEQQIANQEAWRSNIAIIAQRGGLDVANALAEMGVQGADITAQMATALPEDFARMAAALTTQAQLAGSGAANALSTEMQVMAAVGQQGATATVAGIATQLGLGVDQVAGILGQYGVVIAAGVNPILASLGKPAIPMRSSTGGGRLPGQVVYNADGNLYEQHVAQIAPAGSWRVWAEPETGGESYIPLAPAKRERSMSIWRETGKRLNAPEAAFFANGGFATAADVPAIRSTEPFGAPLSTAAIAAMQSERDAAIAFLKANVESVASAGGPAGSEAIGGGWQAIARVVQAAIPQARINSTYRPGDPGYHGRGKAVDFGFGSGPGGAGSAGLASIAAFLYTTRGKTLAELIYDGIGDNTPDVKNGADHTYNAGTRAEHRNHVHAAVYANGGYVGPGSILNPHVRDQGGPLLPGYTLNATGGPEMVVSPAAMPGYGTVPTVNLDNLTITGTLAIGGDGLARIIDGRISQGIGQMNRTMSGRVGV